MIFQTRFKCPNCTHNDTLPIDDCAYSSEHYAYHCKNVITDIFCVTYTHHLFKTTYPWWKENLQWHRSCRFTYGEVAYHSTFFWPQQHSLYPPHSKSQKWVMNSTISSSFGSRNSLCTLFSQVLSFMQKYMYTILTNNPLTIVIFRGYFVITNIHS
jgi:hypothetical protein